MRKLAAITVSLAALLLGVIGCAGVNHDSANPSEDIQTQWVRIETPPSFKTLMFTCIGNMGIYMDQGDANANEIPNDPLCPISRVFDPAVQQQFNFKLVTRTTHQGAGTS